jgi:ribonuclease HIII
MRRQAKAVLTTALDNKGADWAVEWEVDFGGSSIGLALWIAARADQQLRPDPLLAATGRLDASRHVCSVDGIPAKVKAALTCGYRRILVPADDYDQARDAISPEADVLVIGVRHVDDLPRQLADAAGGTVLGAHGTLQMIRKLLPLYGLDLTGERKLENAYRLEVADASSRARVDVFSGRRATVNPTGSGSALASLERLIAERLPRARVEPRDSQTALVTVDTRREKFLHDLEQAGAQPVAATNPYETFRYRLTEGASSAVVIGYTNGKVQVAAGQAPAHDRVTDLLRGALEGLGGLPPRPTKATATNQTAAGPDPDELIPHIGTDEAGKGDYFGPLVCAACYLDADVARTLRELGVRDSKTLSDRRIRTLAEQIRAHLPGRFAVVPLRPARYNSLYEELRSEGKNLNSLVAWGHARGIQNLFGHGVWAEYAVIDKFADERYLHERLRNDTRRGDMRLEHRTKAESDVAVAAASILARDQFVRWLDEASAALGITLPKGAGPQVITAARTLVAQHGPGILREYAKVSFKTTRAVLENTP